MASTCYFLLQFLRALTSYFAKDGLRDDDLQTEQYKKLKAQIELNSLSTEELMLEYFHNLADEIANVRILYCHNLIYEKFWVYV